MRAVAWLIPLMLCAVAFDAAAASNTLDTTLGEADANAIANEPAAPFASDHEPVARFQTNHGLEIHGEVATGVAYSSGHGTATAESARINLHKALSGDSSFDMALGVANYDGFDHIRPIGPGPEHRP